MFSGGDGTKENPFLIGSLKDFLSISDYENENFSRIQSIMMQLSSKISTHDGTIEQLYSGLDIPYFKQTGDIDLSNYDGFFHGIGWNQTIYGVQQAGFVGSYDGNGFAIKNLEQKIYNVDEDGNYTTFAGIFNTTVGFLKNINISNIKIEGDYIDLPDDINIDYMWKVEFGFLTKNVQFALVDNCKVEGCKINTGIKDRTVEATIGGLVGRAEISKLYRCKVDSVYLNFTGIDNVAIIGEDKFLRLGIGGLSGAIVTSTVERCAVNNIEIVDDGHFSGSYSAGFCPVFGDSYSFMASFINNIISDCYAIGRIRIGKNRSIDMADFVGQNRKTIASCFTGAIAVGEINNCYAVTEIINEGTVVEGMNFTLFYAQESSSDYKITSVYVNEETNEGVNFLDYSDGSIQKRTTEEMKKEATYEGWSFDDVWFIKENRDYPRLETLRYQMKAIRLS